MVKVIKEPELSLIVPDYTIPVYGSSFNFLNFGLKLSSFFVHFLASHPASGMLINRKRKQKSENETQKEKNYMNCHTQKL